MAEYIDREALIQELDAKLCALHGELDENRIVYDAFTDGFEECVGEVGKFQFAADVAPVVHGRWEYSIDEHFGMDVYTCSKCRESYVLLEGTPKQNLWNYCTNCGAKMDGGDSDEAD